jgi:hypothetical protein
MFPLAQPTLDEIKSRDNSSLNIEEMWSSEFVRAKNIEDLARYFMMLEKRRLSKAPRIQYPLNTYPVLFIFRNEPFFQESVTTRANFEFHLSQEDLEDTLVFIKSEPDVTRLAREKLRTITNKEMAIEAEKIIDGLRDALEKIDTNNLPPIRVFEIEDGSLLIEWILPHHKIGFSIEPERRESGWFLVSDNHAQSIQASGFLLGENIKWLTAWLIDPVIDYYL